MALPDQRTTFDSGPAPAPWWAWALATLAVLALMSLRFFRRDLIGFMQDEPLFLGAARTQLLTHKLAECSPFAGSQGIHYGAGFVWFASLLELVGGFRPEAAGVGDALFITAAHLSLAYGLTRLFRQGPWMFAVLGGLLASAPFEYYWARLVWDVTFSAAINGFVVVCLCTRERLGALRCSALGVCAGFSVFTHPLGMAAVAGAAVVVVLEARREGGRRGWRLLLSYGLPLLLLCLPYADYLLHHPRVPGRSPPPLWDLGWAVLEPARVLSTKGIVYWFDDAWVDFQHWAGFSEGALDAFGIFTVALLFLASAVAPVLALRSREPGVRRLGIYATVLIPVHLLIFMLRRLDRVHPHYQIATYFLPLLGIAASASWLQQRATQGLRWPVFVRRATAALLMLIIAVQGAFLLSWLRYEIARDGNRFHIPLAEQRRLIEHACGLDGRMIALVSHVRLWPQAVEYLSATIPACQGKRVGLVPPGFSRPGITNVEVGYRDPVGGALRFVP